MGSVFLILNNDGAIAVDTGPHQLKLLKLEARLVR